MGIKEVTMSVLQDIRMEKRKHSLLFFQEANSPPSALRVSWKMVGSNPIAWSDAGFNMR